MWKSKPSLAPPRVWYLHRQTCKPDSRELLSTFWVLQLHRQAAISPLFSLISSFCWGSRGEQIHWHNATGLKSTAFYPASKSMQVHLRVREGVVLALEVACCRYFLCLALYNLLKACWDECMYIYIYMLLVTNK